MGHLTKNHADQRAASRHDTSPSPGKGLPSLPGLGQSEAAGERLSDASPGQRHAQTERCEDGERSRRRKRDRKSDGRTRKAPVQGVATAVARTPLKKKRKKSLPDEADEALFKQAYFLCPAQEAKSVPISKTPNKLKENTTIRSARRDKNGLLKLKSPPDRLAEGLGTAKADRHTQNETKTPSEKISPCFNVCQRSFRQGRRNRALSRRRPEAPAHRFKIMPPRKAKPHRQKDAIEDIAVGKSILKLFPLLRH